MRSRPRAHCCRAAALRHARRRRGGGSGRADWRRRLAGGAVGRLRLGAARTPRVCLRDVRCEPERGRRAARSPGRGDGCDPALSFGAPGVFRAGAGPRRRLPDGQFQHHRSAPPIVAQAHVLARFEKLPRRRDARRQRLCRIRLRGSRVRCWRLPAVGRSVQAHLADHAPPRDGTGPSGLSLRLAHRRICCGPIPACSHARRLGTGAPGRGHQGSLRARQARCIGSLGSSR